MPKSCVITQEVNSEFIKKERIFVAGNATNKLEQQIIFDESGRLVDVQYRPIPDAVTDTPGVNLK